MFLYPFLLENEFGKSIVCLNDKVCNFSLGEGLARMELFLFTANMFNHYKVGYI
jgi:hypothetical protein